MVVASVAVLAYGWWFTDRQPFGAGAFHALLVTAGVLVAAGAAVAATRRRHPLDTAHAAPRENSHFRSAVVAWSTVIVAVVAWELIAQRSSPRSSHPTISSLVESIEQYHVARLALYALWIGLGWILVS